jgi:F-type H+-transporting ATPase subunit a
LKKLLPFFFYLSASISLMASGGVHKKADKIDIGLDLEWLPVTNSMVTSWVVSLFIIILIRLTVGKPKLVPGKGQLVIESIIGTVRSIVQPIVGKKAFFPSFWLLSGLFFFILMHNISGLMPGVGSIGYGKEVDGYFDVSKALIRPGNADLNMTLALALVSMICWFYFILFYAGPKVILYDLFGTKAKKKDVGTIIYYCLVPLFLAVGVIEILSIVFRPVSLTFRLYGNVFGGESLLHSMFLLGDKVGLAWIIPVPFYFMELLIGIVQALVFMLLVAVYIGLICNHGEGEEH